MQDAAQAVTSPAAATGPGSAAAGELAAGHVAPAAPPCDCLAIAALTPIKLELLETVSSKTSLTGATFKIALKQAIVVGGTELVPAGTPGVGEVVHAKKSGGSGVGGELVVTARFLDLGGQHIRLRSMMLSSTGKDNTVLVAASAQAISFLAFAIHGKNTDFPAGSIADAKIAEQTWIPRPAIAATPAPFATGKDVAASDPAAPSLTTQAGVKQ
jgi:hypothetical protein